MIKLFKKAIDYFKNNPDTDNQQYYDIAINAIGLYGKGMIKSCSPKLHHDLLVDIDIFTEQLNLALILKDSLQLKLDKQCPRDIKAMAYNSEVRGCSNDTALDIYYNRLVVINDRITAYDDILQDLKEQRDCVQANLAKCKGLDRQVYYMHVVEGKTLQETSEELHYSIDRVKQISANINTMLLNDK